MPVGLVPEGEILAELNDSNDGRGNVELEMMLNKKWVNGVR